MDAGGHARVAAATTCCFRYFPTKEEAVLFDDVAPVFEEVFTALPAGNADAHRLANGDTHHEFANAPRHHTEQRR